MSRETPTLSSTSPGPLAHLRNSAAARAIPAEWVGLGTAGAELQELFSHMLLKSLVPKTSPLHGSALGLGCWWQEETHISSHCSQAAWDAQHPLSPGRHQSFSGRTQKDVHRASLPRAPGPHLQGTTATHPPTCRKPPGAQTLLAPPGNKGMPGQRVRREQVLHPSLLLHPSVEHRVSPCPQGPQKQPQVPLAFQLPL